jgi:acyl-CoA reductase-like NAD-dependent aldehyde dehydrogenase
MRPAELLASRGHEVPELRHDIGGRQVAGAGAEPVPDAPDGAPLYRCPPADGRVVGESVETARIGFRIWRSSLISDRVAVLVAAAHELEQNVTDLAALITTETGKPIAQAESEVHSAARTLRTYAQEASAPPSRVLRNHSARVWGIELAEPVGVAALVMPWNLPLQLAAMKVGAAIAAGCSFVAKPSPLAAASISALVEALRAGGLPAQVASVVHGHRETALLLANEPGVDIVSVTGSTSTGQDVMRAAAAGPRRCVLELGGKSANIVFDDADLDAAVAGLVNGFVRNQGAVCTAGSRILVHKKVYPEVADRVVAALQRLTVGDPYANVDMGAIRTHSHRDFVRREISQALAAGASVLGGGEDVEVAGHGGAYMRPMLLASVKPTERLWNTELFGPVAAITPFTDDDEAIALADASDYGLAVGVWSGNAARAERVWRDLSVGTVYINSYHRIDSLPLAASGRRASGFGSEGGAQGIAEFLTTKSVHFPAIPS